MGCGPFQHEWGPWEYTGDPNRMQCVCVKCGAIKWKRSPD